MVARNLEISPNVYYTPAEVATMLRISRRSVQYLLDAGHARGVKIGRNWRILGSELLQLPGPQKTFNDNLSQSLMILSEPAFTKVWDNDEDAIYDEI